MLTLINNHYFSFFELKLILKPLTNVSKWNKIKTDVKINVHIHYIPFCRNSNDVVLSKTTETQNH